MITLWRVDAIHDLGGELTHFFEEPGPAEASAEQLRGWGWYADCYAESIERAPPATIHELTNRPHPTAPTPALVALAWLDTLEDTDPVSLPDQAAEQLEQLLNRMAAELGFEMIPCGFAEAEIAIEITCDL